MMSDEQPKKKSFWCTGISKKKGGLVMAMGFAGMLLVFGIIALQEIK